LAERVQADETLKRNLDKKTEELRQTQARLVEFEARANHFEKVTGQLEEDKRKLNQTLQEFEYKFEEKQDKIAALEREKKDISGDLGAIIDEQETRIRKLENELKQFKESLSKKDSEVGFPCTFIDFYSLKILRSSSAIMRRIILSLKIRSRR
jgi:chromosome segregation ATPase